MNLKEILVIPGKRGLYKIVSQGKSNIIVESLADHFRMPIYVSHQASSLKDICVYTHTDSISLTEIFKRIHRLTNGNRMDESKIKDAAKLKSGMREIVPDYDETKVHVSDMKKLFTWYNILHEHNLLSFDDADEKTDDEAKDEIEIKEETPQMENEETPQTENEN
jgi:Mg-chelatase subunit ChlI